MKTSINVKNSNTWQKTMYGNFSAKIHLDSLLSHQKAKKEVNFLIQSLGLKKRQSILDVPCGTGRHSLAFAKRGYFVVGLDINDVCLKKARENCRGIKNIQIKKGNMAQLAWARGKFDILVNMFSSFGFFKTEEENRKVLKGFIQTLKPRGKIVIQTINREWVLKNIIPFHWEETSQFHIVSKRKYDLKTKYVEAHQAFLYKKSKLFEIHYCRVRLYSISEMKTLLKQSGLKKIQVFGSSSGKPAQRYDSSHPIYIAEVTDRI